MTILDILQYPDARLHKVAKPVADIDARVRQLTEDMLATMYDAQGVGLAATQIDVHERVVVIDVSEERNEPMVLINPEITWASPERRKGDEGCLSVPGVYDGVERAVEIEFKAQNVDGKTYSKRADGLLAVCVQHEIDHLNGKVFVEYLSPLKRNRIKSKMLKAQREAARD